MSKTIDPAVSAAASLLGKRRLGVEEKKSALKKASSIANLTKAWKKKKELAAARNHNGKHKRQAA